jgi:hypothetical protein
VVPVTKRNEDIRNLLKKSQIHHWIIAEKLGVSDTTFSRWLRHEMPLEKKEKIIRLIEEVKQVKVYRI